MAVTDSSSGVFSTTASDRLDGSLECGATPLGYANEAKRYGRGMRSAVRASGSSSHDLDDVLVVLHLHRCVQSLRRHRMRRGMRWGLLYG
jgi:hypothetical protein